jgi:hypothetical protein
MIDPRKRLIELFKERYEEVMGVPHRERWGKCYGAMKSFQFDDETTGEVIVDFPSEEEWMQELTGYWDDEWARDKANYSITYFCKHFGKFARVKKSAKKAVERQTEECRDCGSIKIVGVSCSDCAARKIHMIR